MFGPLKFTSGIPIDEKAHIQFIKKSQAAFCESHWMRDAFPYITGELDTPSGGDIPFNMHMSLTGEDSTFVDTKSRNNS
jgi:hypothetical protein